ncbi:hypothetical protein INR49_024165 [Caranx melampygus]|nr:hypothetical protein INR49_024165 [Caranx melampygus]
MDMKRCPLCEVIFPPNYDQSKFEEHVESHWKICPMCSEQFPLDCDQKVFENHPGTGQAKGFSSPPFIHMELRMDSELMALSVVHDSSLSDSSKSGMAACSQTAQTAVDQSVPTHCKSHTPQVGTGEQDACRGQFPVTSAILLGPPAVKDQDEGALKCNLTHDATSTALRVGLALQKCCTSDPAERKDTVYLSMFRLGLCRCCRGLNYDTAVIEKSRRRTGTGLTT